MSHTVTRNSKKRYIEEEDDDYGDELYAPPPIKVAKLEEKEDSGDEDVRDLVPAVARPLLSDGKHSDGRLEESPKYDALCCVCEKSTHPTLLTRVHKIGSAFAYGVHDYKCHLRINQNCFVQSPYICKPCQLLNRQCVVKCDVCLQNFTLGRLKYALSGVQGAVFLGAYECHLSVAGNLPGRACPNCYARNQRIHTKLVKFASIEQTAAAPSNGNKAVQAPVHKATLSVSSSRHDIDYVTHDGSGTLLIANFSELTVKVLRTRIGEKELGAFKTRSQLAPVFYLRSALDASRLRPIFFDVDMAKIKQADDMALMQETTFRIDSLSSR
ncbi:MAG: hypothetical protein WC763_06635 [Candidatus Paceibacterota bacterium]|jgi:hypothetical protein